MKFICIKIFGRILQLEYKDSYDEILDELGREHKWWLYETNVEVHAGMVGVYVTAIRDTSLGIDDKGDWVPIKDAAKYIKEDMCPIPLQVFYDRVHMWTRELTF